MLALQGYNSSDDEGPVDTQVETSTNDKINSENSVALSMKICAAPDVVPTVCILFNF